MCQKFAKKFKLRIHMILHTDGNQYQRNKNLIGGPHSNIIKYVDCGEAIKVEDINEELNGVESVEDTLFIH
jgi:hypothetical protein